MDEAAGTCSGCGRPLSAEAEFCGYCGTKAPERPRAAVQRRPVSEPAASEGYGRFRLSLTFALLGLLLICIAAYLAYR